MNNIRGTCYITKDISHINKPVIVPSFEKVSTDKNAYKKHIN